MARFSALRLGLWAFSAALAGQYGATASAQIEQTAIDSNAFSLGTLTPTSGGLNRTLWQGTSRDEISMLLDTVPVRYQDDLHLMLLRRVMLSPGEGPLGADNALAGAKFMVAAKAGYYRDASGLASIVPGLRSEPALAKVVAYTELFDGDVDQACARGAGLRDGRTDPFWIKLRFVCYIRAGETSAAELTFDLLRRQGGLDANEERWFEALVRGQSNWTGGLPTDALSYAMMRETGATVDSLSDLSRLSPGVVAAIARDRAQPEQIRETALISAMAVNTIGLREARQLVETMPTSGLAADLIAVATQTKGTLQHFETIGQVLSAAKAEGWNGFTARALLLSPDLPSAEPVLNFSPGAGEIALAAMITGQDAVVEKWILALASDSSNGMAGSNANELVKLYAVLNPGSARRLGSYLGFAFTPPEITAYPSVSVADDVGIARFVHAGLDAAGAGSQGPATMVYLIGLHVTGSTEETRPVRDTVMDWARRQSDLDWLDRQALFRVRGSQWLMSTPVGAEAQIPSGLPMPRIKPVN